MVKYTMQQAVSTVTANARKTYNRVDAFLSDDENTIPLLALGTAYISAVYPESSIISQETHTALAVIMLTGAVTAHATLISKRNEFGPETLKQRVTDLAALAAYALSAMFIISPYVPFLAL